ncbi:hypothetical protein, partial [Salmonella sp. s60131]|uniref:hypothetical protein n=1 Tax=Salmonella sp. s60131 TaxID=3159722 RepID=UPI00397EFBCE
NMIIVIGWESVPDNRHDDDNTRVSNGWLLWYKTNTYIGISPLLNLSTTRQAGYVHWCKILKPTWDGLIAQYSILLDIKFES